MNQALTCVIKCHLCRFDHLIAIKKVVEEEKEEEKVAGIKNFRKMQNGTTQSGAALPTFKLVHRTLSALH